MAYMSQDKKKTIAAALKQAIPAGWKWSLAVRHHSTIVLTIAAAPVDFLGDAFATGQKNPHRGGFSGVQTAEYMDVNPYWYHEHFSPEVVAILRPIFAALNDGNHNRSDLQSDYHDVGWYVDVNIGKWNKPFVFTGAAKTIWNSDGTDGPVLICPPPAAKPHLRFDHIVGIWEAR